MIAYNWNKALPFTTYGENFALLVQGAPSRERGTVLYVCHSTATLVDWIILLILTAQASALPKFVLGVAL